MSVYLSFQKSKFLIEGELQEKIEYCPFCDSNKFKNIGYIQRDPDVVLQLCLECGCYTASRVPTGEVLNEYYSKYYIEAGDNVQPILDNFSKRFARHILGSAKIKNTPQVNILDFGSGDGIIAQAIAGILLKNDTDGEIKQINIDLVELNAVAGSSDAGKIKIRNFSSMSELKDNSYQLVIASAIIEHLPYPFRDIDQLLGKVSDNGYFYARTPYVVPFFKVFNRLGLKFDFHYPGHIHDLGDRFWNNLPLLLRRKTDKQFKIIKSNPSLVQGELRQNFIRTILAYILKAPWYLFTKRYKFVGGWEIFLQKE